MPARSLLGAALAALILVVALAAPLPLPLRLGISAIAIVAALALVNALVPPRAVAQTVPAEVIDASVRAKGQNDAPPAAANAIASSPVVTPTAQLGLDDVLAALPIGVLVVGPDGKLRSFNAAAAELFGVPTDRAVSRALIEIVRNFELDRRVTATLRTGAEETGELAFSGSHERSLQVTTRVLREPDGRPNALVIVADQTRMRELETLRREFVSNVSHELRTPLTAVKLMVETLQTDVERPASDEFLHSIEQETERMIALVEDLLDLARLESGKLDLRLSAVDIAQLCRDATQAQRQRAQTLDITIECFAPDEPIKISADRDKLFQVVVNLLDNALRHTPPGGRVRMAVEPGDTSVDLTVSDTGSGIPSTALPHIFERFYVVDPARARGHSGTGLGLSIVKHIIEAHGGTIGATSELGVGTTFRCRLPAEAPAALPKSTA
jgi:two-component system, OmpR family, phosphate regulon sensor histidine kinase PhoR